VSDLSKDDDLIERSSTGDRAAFSTIVDRHARSVLRLARAMTTGDAMAEDVVQETFLKAFRASSTYRPGLGTVRTWIFAIARNESRRMRRERELPVDHEDDRPLMALGVDAGWGAEEAFARAEEVDRLALAMASLSSEDREILVLRDLEAMSGEAVAELLGLALPAMKSRLHRARLRLLAALRETEGGVVENERTVAGLSCSAVLARLGDYVDGDASDAERIENHLRGCSVCERFGGRYSRVVHDVRERLGATPPLDETQIERIRDLFRSHQE
jgi:RNA polymerase sigma-70 factor (ECF subfamily)